MGAILSFSLGWQTRRCSQDHTTTQWIQACRKELGKRLKAVMEHPKLVGGLVPNADQSKSSARTNTACSTVHAPGASDFHLNASTGRRNEDESIRGRWPFRN
ncbi:hypothetical protein RSAG8_09203, partial [Rhizoctonia solani AG-8 WAC10335]